MTNTIDYSAHGFRNTGFGCTVRAVEISVHIVVRRGLTPSWGIYLFHGAPAGAFWQGRAPLAIEYSADAARGVAEQIFGIAGSGQFAVFHDLGKQS
jgi:hypothetical protein